MALLLNRAASVVGRRLAAGYCTQPHTPSCKPTCKLPQPTQSAPPAPKQPSCSPRGPCPTDTPPCRADAPPTLSARLRVCCPPSRGKRPPCPTENLERTWTCEKPLRRKKYKPCVEVPNLKECGCENFKAERRISAAKALHRAAYEEDLCKPPPPLPCEEPFRLPTSRETVYATDGRNYQLLERPPPARCMPPGCAPPTRTVRIARPDCPTARPALCDHLPREVLTVDRCSRRPDSACAGAPLPCAPPRTASPCGPLVNQTENVNQKATGGCQQGSSSDDSIKSRLKNCLSMNRKKSDFQKTPKCNLHTLALGSRSLENL